MFGFKSRTKADASPAADDKVDGKGRPTPSRRDAEAASKARAKASRNPKARGRGQAAAQQQRYTTREVRQGMARGDEKFLLNRDKGPVRRFVRDYIDRRLSFMEYLLPIMVVLLVLMSLNSTKAFGQAVWAATVIGVIVEYFLLMFGLGREIKRRFPDQDTRGWRFYAFFRAIYLRRFRIPKPQVKLGQTLPDNYR